LKIAHIIPGSGGSFYCGNCLRDSKLFDSMREQGHEAIKIPMYLPLFSHDPDNDMTPVFYGAVSLYLKQVFPVFRRAPKWVDRLLNSRPVLRFAARQANSTRASGLEDMTISMLMGEHGRQREELEKMVQWLETHFRPDVIHISNALLLGLAHMLRERLGVPVICSLQDEDVWVDPMRPDFSARVWELMREKSHDIDMFVSVSHYYTDFMRRKLGLPEERIKTLHLGVDPEDYHYINATEKPENIGYLSRMCRENGLDILVDAFILMKKKAGFENVRLLLTGGQTADDKAFLKEQRQKIDQNGLREYVEFIPDFDPYARESFFNRVMLLSVPVRKGEAFGIYLTEAMAAGIPIVQPALGAFPEIIEKSGGGVIFRDNTPEALSKSLEGLITDKGKLRELSLNARQSVEKTFNVHELTGEMTDIYRRAAKNKQQR
jgi:glycosyltransferase involved in cell wall biosynthesis